VDRLGRSRSSPDVVTRRRDDESNHGRIDGVPRPCSGQAGSQSHHDDVAAAGLAASALALVGATSATSTTREVTSHGWNSTPPDALMIQRLPFFKPLATVDTDAGTS